MNFKTAGKDNFSYKNRDKTGKANIKIKKLIYKSNKIGPNKRQNPLSPMAMR